MSLVRVIARIPLHGSLRMVRPGGKVETVKGVGRGVVIETTPRSAQKLLEKRWVTQGPPRVLPPLSELSGYLEGRPRPFVRACSIIDGRSGAVPLYEAALAD